MSSVRIPSYVTWLLVVLLVLSVVTVALIATSPRREVSVVTVTQPVTIPQLVTVTVTQPGAAVTHTVTHTVISTVTITAPVTTPKIQTFRIFFFDPEPGNPWWDLQVAGFEKAVQDLQAREGIRVEAQRFDATSLDQQISQLLQAMALKPDAIVIGARGTGVIDTLKQLRQAGIIVIDVDRGLPDPDAKDMFFGTDNRAAARGMLTSFLQVLESKGVSKPWKFVILKGLPGVPVTDLRYEGYMDVLTPLQQKGEAQVLEVVEVDSGNYAECYKAAQTLVAKYGATITAYITVNNLLSMATVKALQDAGYDPTKDVLVLGFDAQPDEYLAMIKQGLIGFSITQTPHLEAYWAVWAAYYIKTGLLKPPRGATIYTPTYLVLPCNATWVSEFVNYIVLDPEIMLNLARQLTPDKPYIYAPAINSRSC